MEAIEGLEKITPAANTSESINVKDIEDEYNEGLSGTRDGSVQTEDSEVSE